MKARQLKNGSWTISEVSSETIVALAKVLKFANETEMSFGYNIEDMRRTIKELRADGDTLSLVHTFEFFVRCIREQDIEKK
jgi:hypothetical protein